MELLREMKKKWQKYLKEMAEANEKMWKGRKPSCCDNDGKEGKEKEDDERR